jgi:hypothetical protein
MSVLPVANAGFEEGYLQTLRLTWADTERGRGPTGTAIRTGRVCACPNMLTDPAFAPWREQALQRGYASSIALPLLEGGKAFGALTIYARDPDPFSPDEVALLTDLANDLSYGIRAIRLRQANARGQEQLREAATELERSNKDLEQFAYVASHDLQEPLRMVTGFLGLLAQKYAPVLDDKAKEYIGFAVDGGRNMQQLIDDLLAYSRVGARGAAAGGVRAKEALGRALAALGGSIRESGAKVEAGELPVVRADATQLAQLFQNLIGNAIKFRSDRPLEIRVGAEAQGGEWVFRVRDNGIGIDPRFHDRIFVIFQRLHTREKYPGTGMGLAICKKIVERHGGRIWVESKVGEGSTFCFTVPREKGSS